MKFVNKLCFPIFGILFLVLLAPQFSYQKALITSQATTEIQAGLKSEVGAQVKSGMASLARARAQARAHKAELGLQARLRTRKDYSFGQKSNSMMGYFKMLSLLGDTEESKSSLPACTTANITNTTAQDDFNISAINNTDTLEDWLMVSSKSMLSTEKFPPIEMGNGTKITIQLDHEYFRINLAYDHMTKEEQPKNNRMFWFRLSLNNLYYSTTQSDYNILGSITVKHIETVLYEREVYAGMKFYCFEVEDMERNNWKLCALDEPTRKKWICKLRIILNDPLTDYCLATNDTIAPVIFETKVIEPIIVIPTPSRPCNFEWTYARNGADWECDCSEGGEQSPIDLPSKEKAIDSAIKPVFYYDEVSAKAQKSTIDGLMKEEQYLKLMLKDNCLRIFHENFGKIVTLDGAVYIAEEIVIHTPAEHTIDGKKYDMEIEVIHYGHSVGDIAKQVILSFLFEKMPGIYNKFIDDLDFVNLPSPINKEIDITNNIFIPKILYNADDQDIPVMKPFSFYTYQGSLTFPPCTESTIVYVASKPLQIGSTVLQLFQEALRVPDLIDPQGNVIVSNWIPKNSRMLQPLNGRPVYHYDHEKYCGPDQHKKAKPMGHYEKVLKAFVNYFYVNGEKPSGIPGAHVVTEKEAKGTMDIVPPK